MVSRLFLDSNQCVIDGWIDRLYQFHIYENTYIILGAVTVIHIVTLVFHCVTCSNTCMYLFKKLLSADVHIHFLLLGYFFFRVGYKLFFISSHDRH